MGTSSSSWQTGRREQGPVPGFLAGEGGELDTAQQRQHMVKSEATEFKNCLYLDTRCHYCHHQAFMEHLERARL